MKIELNDEKHSVFELSQPMDINNYAKEIITIVNRFNQK
jgi:hypothetical protein